MAKKSHILRLDMSGRFAINVVDNLIVVHHQASKVIKCSNRCSNKDYGVVIITYLLFYSSYLTNCIL